MLEIPVDDPGTARTAATFADRLEVCRELRSEGLTPTPRFVADLVDASRADGRRPNIAVLFQERPPPGGDRPVTPVDFAARPGDLETLQDLAPRFAEAGADSIVIGFVDPSGSPDVEAVSAAIEIGTACGLRIGFHRAFDLADDPADAATVLAALGVDRALAAGTAGYDISSTSIETRVERLRLASEAVGGKPFSILPCGGVRSTNVARFAIATPHVHASCRVRSEGGTVGAFDPVEAASLREIVRARRTEFNSTRR